MYEILQNNFVCQVATNIQRFYMSDQKKNKSERYQNLNNKSSKNDALNFKKSFNN